MKLAILVLYNLSWSSYKECTIWCHTFFANFLDFESLFLREYSTYHTETTKCDMYHIVIYANIYAKSDSPVWSVAVVI